MSNDELSKRAVAWHGWRWMPGMREVCGALCVQDHEGEPWRWAVDGDTVVDDEGDDALPDLDHAGTQGCVLRIIADNNYRKSMADALADVRHAMGRGLKFPEALVFVLEATP